MFLLIYEDREAATGEGSGPITKRTFQRRPASYTQRSKGTMGISCVELQQMGLQQ